MSRSMRGASRLLSSLDEKSKPPQAQTTKEKNYSLSDAFKTPLNRAARRYSAKTRKDDPWFQRGW